jgi:hypothetical protein
MHAFADDSGNLYVAYRDAGDGIHRNTDLLVSKDQGNTFTFATVHPWEINACPMSSAFMTEDANTTLLAWQTGPQVYYTRVRPGAVQLGERRSAPGMPEDRKHPVVVAGDDGSILFAWTEGTGWAKGGSLAWQVYDGDGKPVGEIGRADGVPVWSLPAGFTDSKGSFVLVY